MVEVNKTSYSELLIVLLKALYTLALFSTRSSNHKQTYVGIIMKVDLAISFQSSINCYIIDFEGFLVNAYTFSTTISSW